MTTVALDSSAVVAWILQEPGRWATVDALLADPSVDAVLPGPALTEVVKVPRSRGSTSSPRQIAATPAALGVRTETCGDDDLLRAAEVLEQAATHRTRANGPALSLDGSLILAVVERLGVPVLTADALWRRLAEAGLVRVAIITV